MKISLPSPHEPFVDVATGKVSEIWYRYLSQNLIEATTVELTATAPLTISTANVISIAASTLGFAGQAEEEAGTSSTAVITPSVQQYHPSAAKAWGVVTLAGTVATLGAGYGVKAVASTATGLLRVDLTAPFSSTSYVVVPSFQSVDSGVTNRSIHAATSIGLATTTFTLLLEQADGTNTNADSYYFVCYGDQ